MGSGDTESTPSTKAKRERLPLMTEEEFVQAALRIIQTEGVDALSMRRLSREMGRSAMAAYYYVNDKAELLKLVAKAALADVVVPEPRSAPWDQLLRSIIADVDERMREYPGIADVLLTQMVDTDPRIVNGILGILLDAGFEGQDVLLGYATIHTYLFGRYKVALDHVGSGDSSSERSDFRSGTVNGLGHHLAHLRGRDYFDFGITTIIDGLHARLQRTRIPAE